MTHSRINPKNKSLLLLNIFVFFFSLASLGLFSQTGSLRFKHISTEQGLSQVTINFILQDENGFLWFGTQDGLNRYDGYEFKHFRHDTDNENTISDSYIWCILEDRAGMLWIGTNDGGLNKFDPKTEKFVRYQHKQDNPRSLSHNFVRCLYEDRSGILWIGTNGGGLSRFNPDNEDFTHFQYDNDGLSNNQVMAIHQDSTDDNILWIGAYGGGLNKFDRKTERYSSYTHDTNNPKSLSNNKIMVIYETKSGELWLGTEGGGLNKVDREKGEFESYTTGNSNLNHDEIRAIFEDHEGILWIGTRGGGLNTFDRDSKNFTQHQYNSANQLSLSHNSVMAIYEDRSGVIWLGTEGGGLNKFNRRSIHFALFHNNATVPSSLSSNDVRSIYEDNSGGLWIGTYSKGLNKVIDMEKGTFKNYATYNRNLSHNDIKCIHEDRLGALWIGTRGGGLNRYNQKNGRFRSFTTKNSRLSHDDVRCLLKDSSGEFWIGTEGGGVNKLIDHEKGIFNKYTNANNNLSDDRVFSIYEDRSKTLWVGTRNGGLNKFDRDKERFTPYTTDSGLSHNFVLSIYQDQSGLLWIGTFGGGLNSFDQKRGKFKSYREADGLANNVVYGILEDKNNNLWLSTNRGISRFDPRMEKFQNYDLDDGLQNDEFNAGAYFKNNKGKMFFGGNKGFNAFIPEKIKDKVYVPSIVISNFYLSNQIAGPILESEDSPLIIDLRAKREIILPRKHRTFSFEFSSLDYASPDKNKYRYKLDGLNNKWINTNAKNRRATYANLPVGDYIFRVRGSNEDGIWNEEGISIKLKILPSPWETWWAYILYFLGIMMVGFLILITRYLKQKVKKRTNQLIRSEKLAALGTLVANVAHEINNPTSAVHTTAYNLTRDLEKLKRFLNELAGKDADGEILEAFDEKFSILFGHLDTINESTKRISNIVKTLRHFSRKDGEMKRMNVQEGIEATIALIKTKYKEQVTFNTDFHTPIEIEGNANELNQVYMNIMENACYSMAQQKNKQNGGVLRGTLTVQIRQENNHAVICFNDTGTGISEEVQRKMFDPFFTTKPEGEGTGLGLAISYNIVEKHAGKFGVISKKGHGTTITLYLPLKRKDGIEKKNENGGNYEYF